VQWQLLILYTPPFTCIVCQIKFRFQIQCEEYVSGGRRSLLMDNNSIMERWEFERRKHKNTKIVNINLRQSKFWYCIFPCNEYKILHVYCYTYNFREQNISIPFLHKAQNVLLLIRHEEDYKFMQKFILLWFCCVYFLPIKHTISNQNF